MTDRGVPIGKRYRIITNHQEIARLNAHVIMRHSTRLIGAILRSTRKDLRRFWFEQLFVSGTV